MFIGSARVSTDGQTLGLKHDGLKRAGCKRTFENPTGGAADRADLQQALSHPRAGDALVVWHLDRLGRTLKDQRERAEELRMRSRAAAATRLGKSRAASERNTCNEARRHGIAPVRRRHPYYPHRRDAKPMMSCASERTNKSVYGTSGPARTGVRET